MASPVCLAPIIQKFRSEDDTPLSSLPTYLCPETSKYFVYWSDIQNAFEGIFYLLDESEERLLFMIDEYAELHNPLRIEHNADDEYTVICIDSRGDLSDSNQSQRRMVGSTLEFSTPIERLFTMTTYLYERLEFAPNTVRATFLQLAANTQYYHSLLVKVIEMDEVDVSDLAEGKDRVQILEYLRYLEKKVPDWNYHNICFNMLYGDHSRWDYATSKFFIVLPTDPNSWENSDPSTRQFQFYFLCDNSKDDVSLKGIPQHVHLSNHPGYDLRRPQDFFQIYGDYVLRVLLMIKRGYSDNTYDIPPLDTYKILWKRDVHPGGNLNTNNIRNLIDKTIAHIQEISPPKWIMEPSLTRSHSAAIKTYLDVQNSGNEEGNLHLHIDYKQHVSWRCKVHKQQYFHHKSLTLLQEFVFGQGGHVNMQQARLSITLQSSIEASHFRILLAGNEHIFHIAVNLNWKISRTYMKHLCQAIAKTKAVVLDIDGITTNIHPQGYIHYTLNLITNRDHLDPGLQLITLLNYPQSREQCIYIGNFSLQSSLSPARSNHSWVELRTDLEKFGSIVSKAEEPSECVTAARELRWVQEKHGLTDTISVTIHNGKWGAIFDLKEEAVVEAYSIDAACPNGVFSSGSLLRLTVDLDELEFDQDFFKMININTNLEELNVSYNGHNVFYYIEHIVKTWHESSSRFCLTLVDRMQDTKGRIVAQMVIQRSGSNGSGSDESGSSTLKVNNLQNTSPYGHKDELHGPLMDIKFLQWDCDQVSAKLSDYSASVLDMATLQHSSALKLFTLDASQLSQNGLMSVENVLHRSNLDHLNVICSPVGHDTAKSITQVLGSVQWDTLKSLVLSGNSNNDWMDLWPPTEAPSLLSFQIRSTGLAVQELSHSSVLFVHQIAQSSLLGRLEFEGVQMRDKRDWTMIVDSVDPSFLTKLGLCERSLSQFESSPAMERFKAKFKPYRLTLETFSRHQDSTNQLKSAASLVDHFYLRVELPRSEGITMMMENSFRPDSHSQGFVPKRTVRTLFGLENLHVDIPAVINSIYVDHRCIPWPMLKCLEAVVLKAYLV
ncbi:hypothetical protein BGZ81_010624 [Podila clonocystis]|nr:hypothetical protein BGZ81_010624 [Podila clonocystis]